MRHALVATVACLLALATASEGRAQAKVEVRIVDPQSRPADGTVTMSGPKRLSCRTIASRCTLLAPAGSYVVEVAPRTHAAPKASTVKVPATGTLKVVLKLVGEPRGETKSDKSAQVQKSTSGPVGPKQDDPDAVRKNPTSPRVRSSA